MSRSIPCCAGALVLVLCLAPAARSAGPESGHHGAGDALGAVRFEAPCAPAVRADFDRAVGLLHHMMYVEAKRAFEEIAAKDPECGMARWGIAMSLFQPLWPTRPTVEDLERGSEEVRKAGETRAGSDRDRALVAATEAFYREPASAEWWTRIRRWAAAMQQAYEAHPEDLDVAAFYALSQLSVAPVSDDRPAYHSRAAKVLLGIYEKEATHPGALHYTIHANDVEGRAGESIEVVRSYDDIAPNVPHALHMPTHIFVRLGEWPEVIEWNRKSADAALKFPAGDAVSHHYPHATDYLVYAHLQRGEDAQAKAVLEETLAKGKLQPTFISAFHLAAMPARYAVERREWKEAAALTPRTPAWIPWERFLWPEAIAWFARGLGAVQTGDLLAAREAEQRMKELADRASAAGERDFNRYVEIDRLILAGRIAHAEGQSEEGVRNIRAAAEIEATVEKHPVTPGALLPSYEALGDLLRELGRPKEALEAYEASQKIWPRRYNTLLGAARAAGEAGDAPAARAHYSALLDVVGPETEREGVAEARKILGTSQAKSGT